MHVYISSRGIPVAQKSAAERICLKIITSSDDNCCEYASVFVTSLYRKRENKNMELAVLTIVAWLARVVTLKQWLDGQLTKRESFPHSPWITRASEIPRREVRVSQPPRPHVASRGKLFLWNERNFHGITRKHVECSVLVSRTNKGCLIRRWERYHRRREIGYVCTKLFCKLCVKTQLPHFNAPATTKDRGCAILQHYASYIPLVTRKLFFIRYTKYDV